MMVAVRSHCRRIPVQFLQPCWMHNSLSVLGQAHRELERKSLAVFSSCLFSRLYKMGAVFQVLRHCKALYSEETSFTDPMVPLQAVLAPLPGSICEPAPTKLEAMGLTGQLWAHAQLFQYQLWFGALQAFPSLL